MKLELDLPSEVVDAIADAVAERLGNLLAIPVQGEPWHLLNLEQAAARLGRSPRWVRERAKRGDLPHVRLDGGALAFDVGDLQAFAKARRIPADDAGPLAARLRLDRDPPPQAGFGNGQRLGKPRVERG